MKARHTVADVAARLREAGLRVTAPRVAVLEELEGNRSHPNAIDVHHVLSVRHPSLSLSTVYLAIEAFVKAGLLRRLPGQDGRQRVDGVVEEHDHAVCRRCGDVFDLPSRTAIARPVPHGLPRGMRVLGARVEYDVLCARCGAPRRHRKHSN
jgi:Fe2+ or Zn2+ uptake regulation protein